MIRSIKILFGWLSFVLVANLLLFNCSKRESPLKGLKPLKSLVAVDTINIKLPDNEVTLYPRYIQVGTLGDKEYYFFLNVFNNSIYRIDFDSREIEKHLEIQTTGPNGSGDILGFYVHNQDSTFVIDRFKGLKIYDKTSQVIAKAMVGYDIDAEQFDSDINLSLSQKLYYQNGKFIYPNSVYRSSFRQPIMESLNLENGQLKLFGRFPDRYIDGFFFGGMPKKVGVDYNKSTSEVYYGFHLESDIFIQNIVNEEVRVGNTNIPSLCFECLYSDIKDSRSVSDEQLENNNKINAYNYKYIHLHYDYLNDVVFRVLEHPKNKKTFENTDFPNNYNFGDYTVLAISANDFSVLGSVTLPGEVYAFTNFGGSCLFSIKGKLYILHSDYEAHDQSNIIKFTVFELR